MKLATTLAVQVLAAQSATLSGNMNGKYSVATGGKGPGQKFNDDYSTRPNINYFDVWAPEIATHYGEVFWTDQHNQPLPNDIVKKFDGQVIAIVGYEVDQVMVHPVGQPGQNPEQDVSVPVNWAYNHHYMMWMTGNFSSLKKMPVTPEEEAAHAASHKWVPFDTVDRAATPHPDIPASHFFSEGNGGEMRKSYHGYSKGYAQLLQSPSTWHITPMQIDTRNRDCGATPSDIHNCTHNANGIPSFTPGPEPLQSRYGLGIPASGTNYSGVLECPCNSRYGGAASIYGDNASETKQTVHHFQTQVDTCGTDELFSKAEQCFAAVHFIQVNNTIANKTVVGSSHHPLGCSVSYDVVDGAVTALFNSPSPFDSSSSSSSSSSVGCGSDAPQHVGETESLIGVRVKVHVDASKGPVNFADSGIGKYCDDNRINVIGKPFTMSNATVVAAEEAKNRCQAACLADNLCQACSVDCPSELEVFDEFSSLTKCQWVELSSCGELKNWSPGLISGDVVQKMRGVVTITASGPSDSWFGIGFNAQQMSDQPYALIFNNKEVLEQKLGTCGSEAEHCAGTRLNKTINVISNTVVHERREIVLTRVAEFADQNYYSFRTSDQLTIPLITAIGNTQTFAYHKAHIPATLALVSMTTDTCVCDTGSISKMCDNNGVECQQFVKGCVAAPDGVLLSESNPTCNSASYSGGLQCCHHGRIMLDTDQEIRPELLRYHMKFRFWYQEFQKNVNGTGKPSHLNLPRIYQQTEANAGEYDVPPAFAQKDHPIPGYVDWPLDKPTPGTTCTGACGSGDNMKEDCECIHEIHYQWSVGTGQTSFPKEKGGMTLIYAGGHCHAPSCISIELYRNDTGEILCRQLPVYGKGDVTNDKFDEAGYVALPPCLWGEEDGLLDPFELPYGTPLLSIKKNRNTRVGHFGEMASWQMRGLCKGCEPNN